MMEDESFERNEPQPGRPQEGMLLPGPVRALLWVLAPTADCDWGCDSDWDRPGAPVWSLCPGSESERSNLNPPRGCGRRSVVASD